jgi:hypothetical protein
MGPNSAIGRKAFLEKLQGYMELNRRQTERLTTTNKHIYVLYFTCLNIGNCCLLFARINDLSILFP